jgi:hypothetical protein
MSYKLTKQFINRSITVNQIPAEALERMVTVTNETEKFNLTIDTVQNGDTVYQSDTKLMYRVIDHNNLDNSAGYQVYNGAVYWNNVREKPFEIVENENNFTIAGGTDNEKTLTVDETKSISSKVDKVTGSSLVVDTEISKIHTQNTDTSLDLGGTNPVTAAELATLRDTTVPAKVDKLILETAEKTADYTLADGDQDKIVLMNKTGAANLTVPTNAAVAFSIGTIIGVYNISSDAVTIAGDAGVTVRNAGDLAQYGEVSLRKRATDEWVLAGAVS